MERLSLQDIATVLIEKNGLKKKDADLFVTTMFELVKEGLAADRLVKIKGLGTFKMIDIEPRKSVNISTGESLVIEGHEKVTFTPDTTMKELVNKPFSQFETVPLNEGVTFDDIETTSAPAGEDEPADVTIEPAPEPEPVYEPAPEPEPVYEPEPEPEPEPEEYMSKKMTYISLVVAIVACLLSFAAGYYFHGLNSQPLTTDIVEARPAAVTDSLSKDTVNSGSVKANAESKTVEAVKEPEKTEPAKTEPAKTEPVKTEAKPVQQPKEQTVVSADKYEQMDARIRTGAYRIVGTATEVKARTGDNVSRIARAHLGPGMECYVEVYNGLTAASPLKEGQTVKIPKLELKKKKKAAK